MGAGTATAANLARTFTPGTPMYVPGVDKTKWSVWVDVPKELQTVLDQKMSKIGLDCLELNAQIVLDLYQDMIIKHVLSLQIKDKNLGRILRGNPEKEDQSGSPSEIDLIAGKVARSSLLGQDPWGDNELPATAASEAPEGEDADDAEGRAEKSPSTYSAIQALLKSVQDNVWKYLTVHIRRIVSSEILIHITNVEMKYEEDQNQIRSSTARKRMPWKAYREAIFELLPDSSGAHELMLLMALCRENGESAARWYQRLKIGKKQVEKSDVMIPERLYVDLATRYLTRVEVMKMSTKLANAGDADSLTPIQVKRMIDKLSWNDLGNLIDRSLHPGDIKYHKTLHRHLCDTRVYTLDQAKEYLAVHTPGRAAMAQQPPNKRAKISPVCQKCRAKGLSGHLIRHRTEDCVRSVQEMNLRKLSAGGVRKRERERAVNSLGIYKKARRANQKTNPPPKREEECKTCRKAGRPYRHLPQTCKYAPGGPCMVPEIRRRVARSSTEMVRRTQKD